MAATRSVRLVMLAVFTVGVSTVWAQRAPAPDPLVKENATVKLAAHTYVIPDGNVSLVPNVGIVVGDRATLVIDPGLGRFNGETVLREVAKISKNTELYVASTHFHAEHTTGYHAFPRTRAISTPPSRKRSSPRVVRGRSRPSRGVRHERPSC